MQTLGPDRRANLHALTKCVPPTLRILSTARRDFETRLPRSQGNKGTDSTDSDGWLAGVPTPYLTCRRPRGNNVFADCPGQSGSPVCAVMAMQRIAGVKILTACVTDTGGPQHPG